MQEQEFILSAVARSNIRMQEMWMEGSCIFKREEKMREFQKLLLKIPKGKVTTYKTLSKKLKVHPRTVGILCAKNPYPDKYPCYKVVSHRQNKNIGGYSGTDVVRGKIKRLKRDGVEVVNNTVDLKRFLHAFS